MQDARAKELLAAERRRIEYALSELDRGADAELSHADQHPADEGTEMFEQERDTGIAERLREELDAVARAEERLAAGKFGRSVESGEPIPDERLEVMPSAERTVEEQGRRDRGS